MKRRVRRAARLRAAAAAETAAREANLTPAEIPADLAEAIEAVTPAAGFSIAAAAAQTYVRPAADA